MTKPVKTLLRLREVAHLRLGNDGSVFSVSSATCTNAGPLAGRRPLSVSTQYVVCRPGTTFPSSFRVNCCNSTG